jgi:hypothetical protein
MMHPDLLETAMVYTQVGSLQASLRREPVTRHRAMWRVLVNFNAENLRENCTRSP